MLPGLIVSMMTVTVPAAEASNVLELKPPGNNTLVHVSVPADAADEGSPCVIRIPNCAADASWPVSAIATQYVPGAGSSNMCVARPACTCVVCSAPHPVPAGRPNVMVKVVDSGFSLASVRLP